jgi:hypothetical protein
MISECKGVRSEKNTKMNYKAKGVKSEDTRDWNMKKRGNGGITRSDVSIFGHERLLNSGNLGELRTWSMVHR